MATQYFVSDRLSGQPSGPFTLKEIGLQIWHGKLRKSDLIRQADQTDWHRAGDLIGTVFEKVEARKQQEKELAKAEREAEKQQRQMEKQTERLEKKQARAIQTKRKARFRVDPMEANRGSIWQKIFGQMKPSPYWGFAVQASIINISIVLVMIGAVIYSLFVFVVMAFGLYSAEDFVGYLSVLGLFIVSLIGIWVITFFTVALLVFYRNIIDWMIDMESHANELSRHFQTTREGALIPMADQNL